MNAVSTPLALTCPEWCAHHGDTVKHEISATDTGTDGLIEVAVLHVGPTFGRISTDVEICGSRRYPSASLPLGKWHRRDGSMAFDTPGDLRELASELIAAAKWLEAHQ